VVHIEQNKTFLRSMQVNWEVNLFSLYSRALTAGGQVRAQGQGRTVAEQGFGTCQQEGV